MSHMDLGTAHKLRHQLARMFERDLRETYHEAKASGDRERLSLVVEEMDRRGIEI